MTIKNLIPWWKAVKKTPSRIKGVIFDLLQEITWKSRTYFYAQAAAKGIDFWDYKQVVKFLETIYYDPISEILIRGERFYKKR